MPAELLARVRSSHPDLNISAVLTAALADHADCDHRGGATCSRCGAGIDVDVLAGDRAQALWADLWWDALCPSIDGGLTAEGSARACRDVAARHQIPGAATVPVPRPARGHRAATAAPYHQEKRSA